MQGCLGELVKEQHSWPGVLLQVVAPSPHVQLAAVLLDRFAAAEQTVPALSTFTLKRASG